MRHLSYLAILLLALSSCHQSLPEDHLVGIQILDRNGLSETISIPEKLQAYRHIDFLSSQPFKKVTRVYKKEGKNHSVITTYHPNGLIWQYLEAQDMRAYGLYQEWFSTGQLKISAYVIGGSADVALGAQSDWLFDGVSEVWDEQGRLTAQIPYEKGALHGTSLSFYPNGQVQREIPYQQNLIEGEVTEYFANGQIKEKLVYHNGLKQGTCTGYGPEGQIFWTEEYKNDLLQKGFYFDLAGQEISSVQNGYGFQTFFDDTLSFEQIEVQKGKQDGLIKLFSPENEIRLSYSLKNGKKQGEEIFYYPSIDTELPESKKMSIQWNDDMIHGMVKTWYKSGKLESQKEWARNKKNGASCGWYEEGNLMFIEEYENDVLLEGQYFKKSASEPISTIVQGNGVATLYDEHGILIRKVIYHKGVPIDPES